MRIASLLTASAIGVGVIQGLATASAQVSAPGEPQISVYLKSIGGTGRVGGWAGDTKRFAVGEPFTLLLVAGDLARGDTSICSIGGYSSSTLDELVTRYSHVWRINVTPIEYSAGQQKVALVWARFRTGSADKPAVEGSQQITLDEGDRYMLDFLRRDPTSRDCDTSAVLLDVSAGFKEDGAYADTMLKYELWLVHTDSHGGRVTRQFVTMARQGTEMPYAFPSLRFPIRDLSGATREYDVTMTVEGSIRGRLTAGGKVVLELATNRNDGLTPRQDPPRLRADVGSGRKYLEVALNEALEIKFPVKGGFAAARAGEAPLSGGIGIAGRASGAVAPVKQTEPITVVNGSVRVDWTQFFRGHETSLVLKVTRVQ